MNGDEAARRQPGSSRHRAVLVGVLGLAVVLPLIGLSVAVDAANAIDQGAYDFVYFIVAITVLGGTAVAVGVTILWRRARNRIGALLVIGGLLLMSVFTAWPMSIVLSERGDLSSSGLANWWGTVALLPAIVLLFPAIGILFPDERLPGPRWRWPVLAGAVPVVLGIALQTVAPWRLEGDFTVPNPLAIGGLSTELFELGGGMAAFGAFVLFAVAVAAVIVRYRRSAGVERAQQKWLVASLGAMSIAFPISFATDIGPAQLIDLMSVLTGALVPIAIGIAILRYHVFEIDRIVSRTIAYVLITALLVGAYATSILLLQGPLGTVTGGETLGVALSTLAVAALFQPVRRRVQSVVDRRFDRARFDAERTSAAFAERLRDEVDIATVTTDLRATVHESIRPSTVGLWIRPTSRNRVEPTTP